MCTALSATQGYMMLVRNPEGVEFEQVLRPYLLLSVNIVAKSGMF